MRINIGTYDKKTAQQIREAIHTVREFRNDVKKIDFKSRTYGRLNADGSKARYHSNKPISEADKVAIYLDVKPHPHEIGVRLGYDQVQAIRATLTRLYAGNDRLLSRLLNEGFKGFYAMTEQELVNELIACTTTTEGAH